MFFGPQSKRGGDAPGYEYFDLTTADGSKDNNSIISSAPSYDSATKVNTISITRNTASAALDIDDCAVWYWDIGIQAQDKLMLDFDIQFTDDANMQGSNIHVFGGITSDVTNMNTYGYGAGANYQTNDLRAWRVKGATRSVGGLGASTEGVRCFLQKGDGAEAGVGNLGFNWVMNGLNDDDWESNPNFYSVSNSPLNAANSTDPLLFFIAIGTISIAASIEEVKFKLRRSPIITD